jgi:hypothetical protein
MLKRGKGLLTVGLGVMFALFLTGTVHADTILLGQWYTFEFGAAGTQAFNCTPCDLGLGANSALPGNPPWEFSSVTPVVVSLTDGFKPGDSFTLLDPDDEVGTTPPVTSFDYTCGNDEPACLIDPFMSHALIPLGAGDHSLNIRVDVSPFLSGAAFFRVDPVAAVPEPSAFLLLASGLLGIAWWRYRATP